MNPYWQIAYDHLSIEEIEEVLIAKRKSQSKKLAPINDREKRKNEFKKLILSRKRH